MNTLRIKPPHSVTIWGQLTKQPNKHFKTFSGMLGPVQENQTQPKREMI